MLLGQSVPPLLTCLTAENSEVPRSYRPTQDHVTAGWLGLTLLVVVLPAALGSGGALHRHSRHSQLSLHYTTGQGLSRGCPSSPSSPLLALTPFSVDTAVERRDNVEPW